MGGAAPPPPLTDILGGTMGEVNLEEPARVTQHNQD
jgi:hypothetical protein